ncbi:MAG: dimethyl sulfone monooxygenase SfnG [Chroococcidiopsidaceae cyanobacterium CP_BM_ER_R8_30]|nr:dimethyl sulfone monooxygenase SfnG [Chroococcidiopsidaceae cyanobacterium CP_BM_ER_R8_30]
MDIRFGYWMPLGSGGYVISDVPQRTEWSLDYNARLAKTAEDIGFEYGLAPARFIASHGWEYQQEAITCTAVLSAQTQRLKLISAVHTGLWHPAVVAKMGATIDVYSGGRFAINILSGWFRDEYRAFGEPWLEHDERYRRSEEFIQVLKGMWTAEDEFNFQGDFFRINGGWLKPLPVSQPYPEIFQGGNSKAARRMAGRFSDWYFMNGNSVEAVKQQIDEISAIAHQEGRKVKFGLNGFVILRDTEAEAYEELERIIAHADPKVVNAFAEQVKHAGASTREKVGMWANSDFANLVQPNDGFKTRLMGPAELIAERIREYYEVGVDLILCAFLHYTDELPAFGRIVIPLVRQLPAHRRLTTERVA